MATATRMPATAAYVIAIACMISERRKRQTTDARGHGNGRKFV
jgi:hypothetical protein